MINILFIDDEPNILDGLRRMLHPMRREWEISFASSGAEALQQLSEKTVDVIVSDMKMPGMNGAQLLEQVRTNYSHIVRIILSGYSEKEMIMKSVGTAHQYLSKPCDSEILKATVQRVCALRNILTDENLRRLISQLPTVPSQPTLYSDLMGELKKSEPSTKHIGEIVRKDIGMTVKILQIVNSAFFGLRRQISDACEAVEYLGLDTVSSLALGVGVISQFEDNISSGQLTELWNHGIKVAKMAKEIALQERREMANAAFTAGLLHDIGRIVLAANMPEQYEETKRLIIQDGLLRKEAERQIFGATHSDIGAYLLGLWGLPCEVVQAVAFHHCPGEFDTDSNAALTAVHLADWLVESETACDKPGTPEFDKEYLAKIGMLEKIPRWQEKFADLVAKAA